MKTRSASLHPVKQKIEEARKPKMRKVQYYLCDKCNQPILSPEDGFVIHGNIYVADAAERGGLIGNNFPKVEENEKFNLDEVQETVFCKKCFKDVLGLDKKKAVYRSSKDEDQYFGIDDCDYSEEEDAYSEAKGFEPNFSKQNLRAAGVRPSP